MLGRLYDDFASTGDLEELALLLASFAHRGSELVGAAKRAVAGEDLDALRTAAHRLKGSSLTIGASLTGAVAAELEGAALAKDPAAARRRLPELQIVWRLSLWALEDTADALGEPSPSPPAPRSRGSNSSARRPLRVLLADDEPIALALLRATVECLGHACTVAADGAAALAAYAREAPDVVIADLDMPEFGGLELAERIRACGDRVYIAVASASNDRVVLEAGETIDAALPKPSRADEVHEVLVRAAVRAAG